MQIQSSYKVHLNTISNWELSDPICDSVDKGLTLVRLEVHVHCTKRTASFLLSNLVSNYMYIQLQKLLHVNVYLSIQLDFLTF